MALFAPRSTRASDAQLIKKAQATPVFTSKTKSGGKSLLDRIASAEVEVERYFGKFKDDFVVIREEQALKSYIDQVLKDGIIAIDTETNGLDTFNGILAGLCIYSPSNKAAYIPVHHVSYITGEELPNQLKESVLYKYLKMLEEHQVKILMHNASFDLKVITNMIGLRLSCYWDTMIAGHMLNENEPHGLKVLHDKYCSDNTGVYSIVDLFEGIVFTHVPIKLGYLYAARDAKMTYELYKYQSQYLCDNPPEGYESLKSVYDVFKNIEMPLVPVILDAELRGIRLDLDTANKLKEEYNAKLKVCIDKFNELLKPLEDTIQTYIKNHTTLTTKPKLQWPVNFDSPLQLKELFYDVLKVGNSTTGTGVKELKTIGESSKNPTVKELVNILLEYRQAQKLLTTYIEKLPTVVNPKTGKIHCNFNQIGTATGRFSSNSPNLQNIPSRNQEIRKMFVADEDQIVQIEGTEEFVFLTDDKVVTQVGEKLVQDLMIDDVLIGIDSLGKVREIRHNANQWIIKFSIIN